MIEKTDFSIGQMPNIVLIYVGSNDASIESTPMDDAHLRMKQVIEHIFSRVPGVTIIVGTLLKRLNSPQRLTDRQNVFNFRLPGVIRGLQANKQKVLYVDFSTNWFNVATDMTDE